MTMDTTTRSLIPGRTLREIWVSNSFEDKAIQHYAMPRITAESRRGVAALSLAALIFLLGACALSFAFDFHPGTTYTYALLALLALHVHVSTRTMLQLVELYLLAMTLLVICAASLVLVAQQSGRVDTMTYSSVIALFMLVPVVPWGLREALAVVASIYVMFTASMLGSAARFLEQDFWLLQFLMLFAAGLAVALVSRALQVRKHDLRTQFQLAQAHDDMEDLLRRDPLTGAWNRRFLETEFAAILQRRHVAGHRSSFVLFDVDRFKQINDTHGHHTGDQVLQAIVTGFEALLGEDEYLVRMGGDEFALLLGRSDPEWIFHAVRQRIAPAHDKRAALPDPTFSAGQVTIAPGDVATLEHVYRMADALQYRAKRSGGNRLVTQHPGGDRSLRCISLETA